MSPPDSGKTRPDNLADAWPQHPLAEATVTSAIAASLAKGAAAAVWSLADGGALWWNEVGAVVFDLPRAKVAAGDIGAALARAARSDRPWLERRRLSLGRRPCVATLLFSRTSLRDGTEALVAVATTLVPPVAPHGRAVPPPMPVAAAKMPTDIAASQETESASGISTTADALPTGPEGTAADTHDGEASAPIVSRRLTWQTDATGRLLAGPGASLSQVLGRGAPMQPALLSELFAEHGALVEAAIASGRPMVGVPVVTLAAPDGTSFTGNLFGAPVLDRARRAAGYRGFLVVSGARHADQPASNGALPGLEAESERLGAGEAVGPIRSAPKARRRRRAARGRRVGAE